MSPYVAGLLRADAGPRTGRSASGGAQTRPAPPLPVSPAAGRTGSPPPPPDSRACGALMMDALHEVTALCPAQAPHPRRASRRRPGTSVASWRRCAYSRHLGIRRAPFQRPHLRCPVNWVSPSVGLRKCVRAGKRRYRHPARRLPPVCVHTERGVALTSGSASSSPVAPSFRGERHGGAMPPGIAVKGSHVLERLPTFQSSRPEGGPPESCFRHEVSGQPRAPEQALRLALTHEQWRGGRNGRVASKHEDFKQGKREPSGPERRAGSAPSALNSPARRSQLASWRWLSVAARLDVHLVGAEVGAALADMGQVQRWRIALPDGDMQRLASSVGVAPHQDVGRLGQRRAPDQAIDAVQ